MADIKRVGDAGIHTVEGNVAGAKAAWHTKQREAQKAEYEAIKSKIREQHSVGIGKIDDKFSSGKDVMDFEFRKRTEGLVTMDEFRRVRENLGSFQEEQSKMLQDAERLKVEQKEKERQDKRKKMTNKLSFSLGDDEDDTEGPVIGKRGGTEGEGEKAESSRPALKKVTKNPEAETSYLPDRDRERALEEEKERLRQQWLQEQEVVKNEMLEVVYSYWDGSGHRRSINIKKGTTVGKFLEMVKSELAKEFSDLRTIGGDGLLYVKEDLIIPQHYSFYDLIVTKARGKSGPLFHFDVHEDVRMVQDVRVEKDESHPGKVIQRRWYEKNKHIFPASRWELYDPAVTYERYTIHGK